MANIPLQTPQLSHEAIIDQYQKLSGTELINERNILTILAGSYQWSSDFHPTDGGTDAIRVLEASKEIDIINQLLPTADLRGAKIAEGGFEILPGLKLIHCGKVRNTFAHPTNPERLIVINTDRISTHDVVHNSIVPGKGETLKSVSDYWVSYFASHSATRHIPTQRALDADGISEGLPTEFQGKGLESRTNVFRKLKPFPVEAIVRKFLYGSALSGYEKVKKGYLSVENKKTKEWELGEYVGEGLQKCSEFAESLFTPSTKGKVDINIDFDGMIDEIEKWLVKENICTIEEAPEKAKQYAEQIREYSLALYNTANEHAKTKGLTIADTKFEFGLDEKGNVVLIDESCTPDSSRYWTTDTIVPGKEPEQFDKQAVRDWVMKTWEEMAAEEFLSQDDIEVLTERDPDNYGTEKQIPKWLVNALKRLGKVDERYEAPYVTKDNFQKLESILKRMKKIPLEIPPEIIAIAQEKYGEIRNRFQLSSAQTTENTTHQVDGIL